MTWQLGLARWDTPSKVMSDRLVPTWEESMAGNIDHMNIDLEINTIYSDGLNKIFFCCNKESIHRRNAKF